MAIPEWKDCVKVVGFVSVETDSLIHIANSMYAKRYWNKMLKQEAEELINNIRKSLKHAILTKVNWMDQATKERAKNKLSHTKQYLGFMDEYLDREKIDGFHKGLEITKDQFFVNSLNIMKLWTKHEMNKLREKIDQTSWTRHELLTIAAAYYSYENSLEVSAGILQVIYHLRK